MFSLFIIFLFFFFKQKTAYEFRIRDWSSDVCSSDLISPDSYERFSKNPKLSVRLSEPYQTLAFALNSARGPTADLSVRRAINHAVNTDLIVQTILHGTQKTADTLSAPNVPYADIHLQPNKFDPELAERMRDAARWPPPAPGPLRARDGGHRKRRGQG